MGSYLTGGAEFFALMSFFLKGKNGNKIFAHAVVVQKGAGFGLLALRLVLVLWCRKPVLAKISTGPI